jgi:tetratricopeptide (TPR) repeat protein
MSATLDNSYLFRLKIGTIFKFNSSQDKKISIEDLHKPQPLQRTLSTYGYHSTFESCPPEDMKNILYIVIGDHHLNNITINQKQWHITRIDTKYYVGYIIIEDNNGHFSYCINQTGFEPIKVEINIIPINNLTIDYYLNTLKEWLNNKNLVEEIGQLETYTYQMCILYNIIGKKYDLQQNYYKAIECYNIALEIDLSYSNIKSQYGNLIELDLIKAKFNQKEECYKFIGYLYQIKKTLPNKYSLLQPCFIYMMYKDYFFQKIK